MLLLLGGDEYVVLVLPFLFGAVPEGSHSVAVFLVVEPLPFVFETVRSLADPETGPLVVFPFAQVGFRHACVHVFVLHNKTGVGVGVETATSDSTL